MGVITGLLTLPLAPYRGVVWIAEVVEEVAEEESLASLADRLQRLHEDHRDGLLNDEELAEAERQVLKEFGDETEG